MELNAAAAEAVRTSESNARRARAARRHFYLRTTICWAAFADGIRRTAAAC